MPDDAAARARARPRAAPATHSRRDQPAARGLGCLCRRAIVAGPAARSGPAPRRAVARCRRRGPGSRRLQGRSTSWERNRPAGKAEVTLLVGATPEAERELWRHLCEIDWIATVTAGNRGVDDPLQLMLADGRSLARVDVFDCIWARLLDLPAALGRSSFPARRSGGGRGRRPAGLRRRAVEHRARSRRGRGEAQRRDSRRGAPRARPRRRVPRGAVGPAPPRGRLGRTRRRRAASIASTRCCPRPPHHGPPPPTDVQASAVPKATSGERAHHRDRWRVLPRQASAGLAAWYHEVLGLPVTDSAPPSWAPCGRPSTTRPTSVRPAGVHGELPRRRPRRRHRACAGRRHRVADVQEDDYGRFAWAEDPKATLRALGACRRQDVRCAAGRPRSAAPGGRRGRQRVAQLGGRARSHHRPGRLHHLHAVGAERPMNAGAGPTPRHAVRAGTGGAAAGSLRAPPADIGRTAACTTSWSAGGSAGAGDRRAALAAPRRPPPAPPARGERLLGRAVARTRGAPGRGRGTPPASARSMRCSTASVPTTTRSLGKLGGGGGELADRLTDERLELLPHPCHPGPGVAEAAGAAHRAHRGPAGPAPRAHQLVLRLVHRGLAHRAARQLAAGPARQQLGPARAVEDAQHPPTVAEPAEPALRTGDRGAGPPRAGPPPRPPASPPGPECGRPAWSSPQPSASSVGHGLVSTHGTPARRARSMATSRACQVGACSCWWASSCSSSTTTHAEVADRRPGRGPGADDGRTGRAPRPVRRDATRPPRRRGAADRLIVAAIGADGHSTRALPSAAPASATCTRLVAGGSRSTDRGAGERAGEEGVVGRRHAPRPATAAGRCATTRSGEAVRRSDGGAAGPAPGRPLGQLDQVRCGAEARCAWPGVAA